MSLDEEFIAALRTRYVRGEIEIGDFEADVERILRGDDPHLVSIADTEATLYDESDRPGGYLVGRL